MYGRVLLALLLALASVASALPVTIDPVVGPGACAAGTPAQLRAGTGGTWRSSTFERFDAGNVRGLALYAPSANTVYAAYMKLRTTEEYAPASIVLLKSENGGWTWSTRVLDASVMDSRDPSGNPVAIDGSGRTVAVAWQEHRGPNREDVRLKVAISTDDGATFRNVVVVPSRGGEAPGISVPDPLNIIVSYRDLSGVYGGLAIAHSRDAGATWQTRILYDRVAAPRHTDVSAPDALELYAVSGAQASAPSLRLHGSLDSGLTWTERLASSGAQGPSVSSPAPLEVYVADGTSELGLMKVKVGLSRDGGRTWCLRVFDQANVVYGTALEATSPTQAWVGYWKLTDAGTLVVARTEDRGVSWRAWTVPVTYEAWIDFDIASPTPGVVYAAYIDGYDMRVARLEV